MGTKCVRITIYNCRDVSNLSWRYLRLPLPSLTVLSCKFDLLLFHGPGLGGWNIVLLKSCNLYMQPYPVGKTMLLDFGSHDVDRRRMALTWVIHTTHMGYTWFRVITAHLLIFMLKNLKPKSKAFFINKIFFIYTRDRVM